MVMVGSAIGATIPTTFGQTKCNVLVDTGAMKSCMSQAYYQQLMLLTSKPIYTYQVKSANGSNLCPIGITECELKIGQKEYKNDFVVGKNLIRPCILGIDFLKKHGIFAGWTPTGKFKLIAQQEFLVESLMKGPMIHNKQGIEIPEKNLAIIKTSVDTRHFLLANEHPNLIMVPTMHIMQGEKHDCIPLVLIDLAEDEKIFLRKGEILGHLEPSSIEINEIVKEDWPKEEEIKEEENEAIPLEKKFITSPAEVNTHRKMQLQDAEVAKRYKEQFKKLCKECEDVFSKDSTDIGKTPLITMDILTHQYVRNHIIYHSSIESGYKKNLEKAWKRNIGKGWGDSKKYITLGKPNCGCTKENRTRRAS